MPDTYPPPDHDQHDHEPKALWERLIDRYGVQAAMLAFLIYFVTQTVAGDVRAMRTEHLELRFFLRAICINAADMEWKRVGCIPPNELR